MLRLSTMSASASAKCLTLENPSQGGEWTVVLPRRGKQRRHFPKIRTLEQEQRSWAPSDLEIDLDRESRLMQKMHISMKKLESSEFYHGFLDQIHSPRLLDCILRVLGSELKMQMVIYGIGSIDSFENPRSQLSLAILMKRKLNWIGEIEVFDPVLSATESRVLKALGCSVLTLNEQGRRQALKPTLFFMPHCEAVLYNNLLQANWSVGLLNHIVLFGNSFKTYEHYVSMFKNSSVVDFARHILAAKRFTEEFEVKTGTEDYFEAFHDSSWHFFCPSSGTEIHFFNNSGDSELCSKTAQ